MARTSVWTRALVGAVVAVGLALPGQAAGAIINVTKQADKGVGPAGCSLREAIDAAFMNSPQGACTGGDTLGTDTIVLPASATHYTLTGASGEDSNASGDLDVKTGPSSDVVIKGAGPAQTFVDADGVDRVFDIQLGPATIRDLTVTGGQTPNGATGLNGATGTPNSSGGTGESVSGTSDGGGISVASNLTLINVVVSGNHAGTGGGGGLAGAGQNAPSGAPGGNSTGGLGGNGANGGGITNQGGTLNLMDSTITANTAGQGGPGGDGGAGGTGDTGSTGFSGGTSTGGPGGFGGNGGGISQGSGSMTLTRTVVSDNLAGASGGGGNAGAGGLGGVGTGAFGGAGGASTGGAGGSFGGSGGGIDSEAGSVTITDSTIRDNRAGGGGDGGKGGAGGNGAGGAGVNQGGSGGNSNGGPTGFPGFGGGINMFDSLSQPFSISRSAVVNNSAGVGADGGGGGAAGAPQPGGANGNSTGGNGNTGGIAGGIDVSTDNIPTFSNVTVASNHATDGGNGGAAGTGPGTNTPGNGGQGGSDGGLINGGNPSFSVTHATIASNTVGAGGTGATPGISGFFGGFSQGGTGTVTLRNTIVANNDNDQCSGVILDGGHNLSFPDPVPHCAATLHTDPLLGPLQNNGGPTPTMELGIGSPALNAAGTGFPCAATDQRGVTRPKGTACDIGALEVSPPGATTGGASAITSTGAKVAGSLNPGGLQTVYRFQYGKTTAYGSATPVVVDGSGESAVAVLATLTGLLPTTTYHYRLAVTNPDGLTNGVDRTFKTAQVPFAGVKIPKQSVKVKNGAAQIKLSCPVKAVGKCKGTLKLSVKVKFKKNGKKKTKTVALGSATFAKIAAGKTGKVKVHISSAGQTLLQSKGKLTANATANAKDARNKAKKTTGKVALKR